jgi:hypothetical protein
MKQSNPGHPEKMRSDQLHLGILGSDQLDFESLGSVQLHLESLESDQLKVENLGSGDYFSGIEISGKIRRCYLMEIHRTNQLT